MNIGYLINAYPRPSQSFIRREMAALEAEGVRVQRYAIRTGEPALDGTDRAEALRTRYVLSVGFKVMLLALVAAMMRSPIAFCRSLALAWQIGRRSDRGVLIHLIYLAEACVLKRWFEQDQIEHVHSHFGTNSTVVAMICRELGGPTYSFTAHGPEEFDKPEALSLGEKIHRAAFVVAVCEFGRSQLFRWCRHENWHKVHVVHCGVDESFLTAESKTMTSEPRLLSVGRLAEQKGQMLLIEAASILKRRGIRFKLVIVGDGPLRPQIEALIEKYALDECVTLAGWQSNARIRDLMSEARALVMPSFAEGLPVVLMESLSLGRPVISTYIAGIPELVDNETNGWLVPAGDVEALAGAMADALAAAPAQLITMGEHGAQRVRRQHDASIEAAKLTTLFRHAIAQSPQPTAIDEPADEPVHAAA